MSNAINRQGSHGGDTRLTLPQRGLTSGASWIACADVAVQNQFLNDLDEGELRALPFLFEFWAMPHQLPPEGDWRSWVILGGGDSGILACTPDDRRPDWEASRKRLVWPNGAVATVHTAHDPDGLRGPQFDAAWVDELAKWKRAQEARRFVSPPRRAMCRCSRRC